MTQSTQDKHHTIKRRYREVHNTLSEPLQRPKPVSVEDAPTRSLLREMCKRMLRHGGNRLDR